MTSMTMNGGTLLRADGCSRLFAFSSITTPLNRTPGIGRTRPADAAFDGFLESQS
jgi:hypothetical protein